MKRALLAKHVLPGQTPTVGRTWISGRTHISGPDANRRLGADHRPNAICWPERNLLVLKTSDRVFPFGASDHDGGFSFPAALGGAEAYLFRWLAVTRTLLDVQVIITRSSHSKGFGLDRAEPARCPFPGAFSHPEA